MKLSIVIVNFNTKKLTLDCLFSIKQNPPSCKYEIVVVDNGSTDGSVDELKKNKNIKLIQNTANLGFAKANNQGIKTSSGEYVLLLNSDTKVKKGSLDLLIDFALTHKDAGAVGPKLLNADGSVQASAFNLPTITRAVKQHWLGLGKPLNKFAPAGNSYSEVEELVMAAYLITPQALKKVGLLDEKYFFFYEDFDYAKRLKQAGLKIYYLPESEIIHYHGASGSNLSDDLNQWRRLIPSSKIYHGVMGHYIFNFILWTSQKIKKLFKLVI